MEDWPYFDAIETSVRTLLLKLCSYPTTTCPIVHGENPVEESLTRYRKPKFMPT